MMTIKIQVGEGHLEAFRELQELQGNHDSLEDYITFKMRAHFQQLVGETEEAIEILKRQQEAKQ